MQLAAEVGAAGAHGGMTDIDLRLGPAHAAAEGRTRHVSRDPDVPAACRDADDVRARREGGQGSRRHQPARRLPARPPLRDVRHARRLEAAVAGFHQQIAAALPIVERHKMPLGIENHKDWRVDQQVALLEHYSSEYLGVCAGYRQQPGGARRSRSRRWKSSRRGRSTSISRTWRWRNATTASSCRRCRSATACWTCRAWPTSSGSARPEVRFSLEMITRDPLARALPDGYATGRASTTTTAARDLARMLTRDPRPSTPRAPLPRISGLDAGRAPRARRRDGGSLHRLRPGASRAGLGTGESAGGGRRDELCVPR